MFSDVCGQIAQIYDALRAVKTELPESARRRKAQSADTDPAQKRIPPAGGVPGAGGGRGLLLQGKDIPGNDCKKIVCR